MKEVKPPSWAERFLGWYCDPYFLEEIEGDIYELFDRRVATQGQQRARLLFIWDVIRFLRWSNIKKSNSKFKYMNNTVLFANYLKLGIRNIRRNLPSATINILGLAMAISFAITVFIFVDAQYSVDKHHANGDRIYQLTNYVEQEGEENLWGYSPFLLGPAIAEEHPAVEYFTRMKYVSASIRHGDHVFDETVKFVDPDFMRMMDFEVSSGNRFALNQTDQIVISQAIVTKYFEYEEPVGKDLSFKFLDGEIRRFTVGAVLEEYPYNAGVRGNFFVPISNYFSMNADTHIDWSDMTTATFIMMREGQPVTSIESSYDRYIQQQHGSNPDWKIQSILPISLWDLSTQSYLITGGVSGGGHPAGRLALMILAGFLLGIACFNFMNISVAASTKRLKEIALRKVMGSVKAQIINQFLTENVLQCFFALIAGIVMAYFLFIPGFDQLIPQMDLQFRAHDPMKLALFLVVLLLVVGLISGAYPAFYISRFDAISIFKGSQKFGSGNLFSKVLLGFQLFLASFIIVGCFVMVDQSIYLSYKDWGYTPEGTFSVFVNNQEQYDLLKNELIKHPDIQSTTASTHLIGRGLPLKSIEYNDRQIALRTYGVSQDYMETMQLRMEDGRELTDRSSDQEQHVIVNETFVQQIGWQNSPVNKTFKMDSVRYTVVGVVKDFHYYSFFSGIEPLVIKGLGEAAPRYISVKASPDKLIAVHDFAREKWQEVAPNDPFDAVFQEDSFNDFYQENDTNIKITLWISAMAIILASLGLYGLLAFNIQKKLKEFSIRKVLGASPKTIIRLAGRQYSWILLIAFVLGAPLGFLGMSALIQSVFPDPKAISVLPFIVAISIIVITLVVTVSGQVIRAIRVNPADVLRNE